MATRYATEHEYVRYHQQYSENRYDAIARFDEALAQALAGISERSGRVVSSSHETFGEHSITLSALIVYEVPVLDLTPSTDPSDAHDPSLGEAILGEREIPRFPAPPVYRDTFGN